MAATPSINSWTVWWLGALTLLVLTPLAAKLWQRGRATPARGTPPQLTAEQSPELTDNVQKNKSWVVYLKGQGILLLGFLLLGGMGSWVSTRWGPAQGWIGGHVRLLPFDSLSPASHEYREFDTGNYRTMTVFAKTISPQDGVATITFYGDRGGQTSQHTEVRRLTTNADAWIRWDQQVFGQHMSLLVAPPTELNTAPATEVTVLVYLTPK